MAIRLTNGAGLRSGADPITFAASLRKFGFSARVRVDAHSPTGVFGFGMGDDYGNPGPISVKRYVNQSDPTRVNIVVAARGSATLVATVLLGVPFHIGVSYDYDATDGVWVAINGRRLNTWGVSSTTVPANQRARAYAPGDADMLIESMSIFSGVAPTLEQFAALRADDAAALAALGAAATGGWLHWTLAGVAGSPAGGAGDPGTTSTEGLARKLDVYGGAPVYGEPLTARTLTSFEEPTVMSSGRVVNIPVLVELAGGAKTRTTFAGLDLARPPKFRINGGPEITPLIACGGIANTHDALAYLLPTAVGANDSVTWSVGASALSTDGGGNDAVVDAPCRNRVGRTSYDRPEGSKPYRAGTNITLAGPLYWTAYTLVKNRGKNLGTGGVTASGLRPDGSFNTTMSGGMAELGAAMTRLDGAGYPTQEGPRYLAWTDLGAAPSSPDEPCEFQLYANWETPQYAITERVAARRDETLEDGSVRKSRIYDVTRRIQPATLAESVDAAATTLKVDNIWFYQLSNFTNAVLEIDGETIVAPEINRSTTPMELRNCRRGVKGTPAAHAAGTTGALRLSQFSCNPVMRIVGVAGKVNYKDLTYLGPEDFEDPGPDQPAPSVNPGPMEFSAEFKRWAAEGLGVIRFMDSTPTTSAACEPEQIRRLEDARWSYNPLAPFNCKIAKARAMVYGPTTKVYMRTPMPGFETYSATLAEPLAAVATGTKETINVAGTVNDPVMIGSRLLNGGEEVRVISGVDGAWLVERGSAGTTPEARAAGPITVGWRVAYTTPATFWTDRITVEFETAAPHGMATFAPYGPQRTIQENINVTARRNLTLTAPVGAADVVLPVATAAPDDWDWLAAELVVKMATETLTIASVDRTAGTITVKGRAGGAARASGTALTTQSGGVLCETAGGANRFYHAVFTSGYELRVTGPRTFRVDIAQRGGFPGATVNVVGEQTIDNVDVTCDLTGSAFPMEVLGAASTHANAWCWLNVPGYATEAYAYEQGKRLRETAAVGSTVMVELGNEVWNYISFTFWNSFYDISRFAAAGQSVHKYHVIRSYAVFQAVKRAFAEVGRGDEVLHALMWQPGMAGHIMSAARDMGIPFDIVGTAPYLYPLHDDEVCAFINAADDDAAVCDLWTYKMAHDVRGGTLRAWFGADRAAWDQHVALTGQSPLRISYEGGLQDAIPRHPTTTEHNDAIPNSIARNRDVRYHPNWRFAELDSYSLMADIGGYDGIALFNCAQAPQRGDINLGAEALWGMNTWWGQRPGFGDGRDGGIDNRLNIFRPGTPNSKTEVDCGDMKESVRWQALIDYNKVFFAGGSGDPDPEPGGELPTASLTLIIGGFFEMD